MGILGCTSRTNSRKDFLSGSSIVSLTFQPVLLYDDSNLKFPKTVSTEAVQTGRISQMNLTRQHDPLLTVDLSW